MIDVLIAENDQNVREALISTLENNPDIHVVGEAPDGINVIKLAMRLMPDIILMDIKMPGIDGLEAAKIIRALGAAKDKEMKVMLLSTHYDKDYMKKSQESGVYGYLLKGHIISKLANAVMSVADGFVMFDRSVLESQNELEYSASQKAQLDLLSSSEIIILKLIVSGKNNVEIANELYLSNGTVRNYVSNMMSKLDCKSSRELASFGTKAGF